MRSRRSWPPHRWRSRGSRWSSPSSSRIRYRSTVHVKGLIWKWRLLHAYAAKRKKNVHTNKPFSLHYLVYGAHCLIDRIAKCKLQRSVLFKMHLIGLQQKVDLKSNKSQDFLSPARSFFHTHTHTSHAALKQPETCAFGSLNTRTLHRNQLRVCSVGADVEETCTHSQLPGESLPGICIEKGFPFFAMLFCSWKAWF